MLTNTEVRLEDFAYLCQIYKRLIANFFFRRIVPSIILASFAMQESSCNPETVGGGGEQGLMQITKDKCGGAPGGNCKDPVGIQIILSSSLPLF